MDVLLGIVADTLITTAELLLFSVGIFLLLGSMLHLCERLAEGKLCAMGGLRALYPTAWIGVPVHELSHAGFNLLFGHRLDEVRLFKPDPENGVLGYVRYSYDPESMFQRIGKFFVGIGPLIGGCLAVSALGWLLCPDAAIFRHDPRPAEVEQPAPERDPRKGERRRKPQVRRTNLYDRPTLGERLASLGRKIPKTLGNLLDPSSIRNPLYWIFLIAAFCIAIHAGPSGADLRGATRGFAEFCAFTAFINLILAAMGAAAPGMMAVRLAAENWWLAKLETLFALLCKDLALLLLGVGVLYALDPVLRLARRKRAGDAAAELGHQAHGLGHGLLHGIEHVARHMGPLFLIILAFAFAGWLMPDRAKHLFVEAGVISWPERINPDLLAVAGERVAAGRENRLRFFDIRTQAQSAAFEASSRITQLAFSPDSRLVAVGQQDGRVTILDAMTGLQILQIQAHASAVTGLAYGNTGAKLASGASAGSEIKIWQLPSGSIESSTHVEHTGPLCFDAGDTALLIAAGTSVRLSPASGLPSAAFTGHEHQISFVGFDVKSRLAVSVDTEGHSRVWNLEQPKSVRAEPLQAYGFRENVSLAAQTGLLACAGNGIYFWDVAAMRPAGRSIELLGNLYGCALSPDGARLVALVYERDGASLHVWRRR